jgi:cytochrome c peroxidase
MLKYKIRLNSIFLILITLVSCQKKEVAIPEADGISINLPANPFEYVSINLPSHLTTNVLLGPGQNSANDNDNSPITNPIINDRATLGRVLFYDKTLSADGTISCASCHRQDKGFFRR